MRIQNIKFIFLTLVFYLGCEQKPAILATVGNLTIDEREYEEEIKKYIPPQSDLSDLSMERKKEYLNGLILKKLKLNAAYEAGLDRDSTLSASHQNYVEKLVNSKYFELKIMDRLVPRSAIQEYLDNRRYEIRATHIILTYNDIDKKVTRTREETKALAQALSEQARSGSDFTELVENYSNDPRALREKGELPFFTWGQMVDPFQRAAWDLDPDEISDPVETRYGFHIIRVNERREVKNYKPASNEEAIFKIKQNLFSVQGNAGRELTLKHEEELKNTMNFYIDEDKLSFLSSVITVKVNSGELSAGGFSETESGIILATWDGGNLTFADVLRDGVAGSRRILEKYSDINFLMQEINKLAVRKLFLQDARELGLYKDKWVKYHATSMFEQQLTRVIETRQINDMVNVTTSAAYSFYTQNPDKFIHEEEMQIWEILFGDRKLANQVLPSITRKNFKSMAKKYSIDKKYGPTGGYIGYMQKAARGPVSQKAFELGPGGKIGGPVKFRTGWTVIMTGEKREKFIRPFEEMKGRATSLLKRKLLNENKIRWESELREKYAVVINENLLSEN